MTFIHTFCQLHFKIQLTPMGSSLPWVCTCDTLLCPIINISGIVFAHIQGHPNRKKAEGKSFEPSDNFWQLQNTFYDPCKNSEP